MADNTLVITGEFKDGITPALKQIESGIIRFVGSISAAMSALSAFGAPIAQAAQFQQQMLNVKKTTDFTDDAIQHLGASLLNLSESINITAVDLAKIAELGGQLGVSSAGPGALLAFTEEIARAVTALDVSAEEASTSLGKLINIFNISPEKYRNVISVINELSNVSTAKPEELFDIMRRIGNLGGSVNVSQAAALSATMVDLGLTAETAGTSLTKVFSDMKASAADFANFMGVSTQEWSQQVQKDGVGALTAYLKKLNEMPPAIAAATKQQMTGGGRIFEMITKLQAEVAKSDGGLLARRVREAEAEYSVGTSALREQQSVLSGLSAQWQVFKNRVSSTFIEAGNQSLPQLTAALRELGLAAQNPETIAALKAGVSSVVGLVTQLTHGIAELGKLKIDWGYIIGAATLALASKTLTIMLDLLTRVALQGASSGGGLIQFTTSVFGLVPALQQAQAQLGAFGDRFYRMATQVRVDAAKMAADVRTAALATAGSLMENQLGSYRNQLMRQADAYKLQKIDPLEQTIAQGGTLTATQNRQLAAYRTHYARIQALAKTTFESIANDAAAVDNLRHTQYMGNLRTELTAYRNAILDKKAADTALAAEQQNQAAQNLRLMSGNGAKGLTGALSGLRMYLTEVGGLGQALLIAAGRAEQFNLASTAAGRAAAVAATTATLAWRTLSFTITLAGRAIQGVIAVASRILMVFAFVQLIAQALEFLGVLDGLKDKVAAFLGVFGIKRPSFLDTKQMEDDEEKATAIFNDLVAKSQAFEQRFGQIEVSPRVDSSGLLAFDSSLASATKSLREFVADTAKKVKFNFEDPTQTQRTLVELATAYGQLGAEREAIAAKAAKQADEEARLNTELFKARGTYDFLVSKGKDATEAAAKVASLQEELAKLAASDVSGKAIKAETQLLSAQNDVLDNIISAMDPAQAKDFFGAMEKGGSGTLQALKGAREQMDALAKATKTKTGADISRGTVDAPLDTLTPDMAREARKAADEYNNLSAQVNAYKLELMNLPSLAKLFPDRTARSNFIDALAASADKLGTSLESVIARYGSMDRAAKGLGNVQIPMDKNIESLSVAIKLAATYRQGLSQLASIAQAQAKDAANAVNRAMERHRQDIQNLATFATNIQRNVQAGNQTATVQLQQRVLDTLSSGRISGLNAAKSLEQEILSTIQSEGYVDQTNIAERLKGLERAQQYGRETLMSLYSSGQLSLAQYQAESKALDYSVAKQKEVLNYYYERPGITRQEAQVMQTILDLKYKAAGVKISDEADLAKSKLQAEGIVTSFKTLQADATTYKTRLTEIATLLTKDNVTPGEKSSLIEERNRLLQQYSATLTGMRQEAEKYSSIDPVAGKLVIDQKVLDSMKSATAELTKSRGQLDITSAQSDEATYSKIASQLNVMAKAYEEMVNQGIRNADTLGVSKDALEKYVAAAGQLPDVQKKIADFQSQVAAAAGGNLSVVPGIEMKPEAIVKSFQESIAKIDKAQLTVQADVFPTLGKGQLEDTQALLRSYLEGAAQQAQDNINSSGGLRLDAQVDIKSIRDQSGALGINTGTLPVQRASGGPVYGAGTATSDSIPALLSHGEWVVNAKTVRMFGSSFFSLLQGLASSGLGLSYLRTSVAGFAGGGLVGSVPTSLQSSSKPPVDTVALDLSFVGKKKARLYGSRDQMSGFIDAMNELAKGMK